MQQCSIKFKTFFVRDNELSWDSSLYNITKADNRFVVLKDGGGYVIVRHVSDKSGSVKWAIRRKLVNFFSVV